MPAFPQQRRAVLSARREASHSTDVKYVVFYDKPMLKFERLLETYLAFSPKGIRSYLMAMPVWMKEKLC